MKIKEATDILKSIGWSTYIEGGDRGARFALLDRTVDIGYIIRRYTHDEEFSASPVLYTGEFSAACSRIEDVPDDDMPFIVPWNWPGVTASEIKEEHIHQASQMGQTNAFVHIMSCLIAYSLGKNKPKINLNYP